MSDADDADGKKPFQIRGFPVATRKLALACAAKAGLTMPEWMDRAVHSQSRIDRDESVFPPLAKVNGHADDDEGLVELLNAAAAIAAANGRQLRSVPGLTSLVAERVRKARGLPPLAPRRLGVKHTLQISKTEADGLGEK